MRDGVVNIGKVEAWKTSDGEQFFDEMTAEIHQRNLDEDKARNYIEALAENDHYREQEIDSIVGFIMGHKEELAKLLNGL